MYCSALRLHCNLDCSCLEEVDEFSAAPVKLVHFGIGKWCCSHLLLKLWRLLKCINMLVNNILGGAVDKNGRGYGGRRDLSADDFLTGDCVTFRINYSTSYVFLSMSSHFSLQEPRLFHPSFPSPSEFGQAPLTPESGFYDDYYAPSGAYSNPATASPPNHLLMPMHRLVRSRHIKSIIDWYRSTLLCSFQATMETGMMNPHFNGQPPHGPSPPQAFFVRTSPHAHNPQEQVLIFKAS